MEEVVDEAAPAVEAAGGCPLPPGGLAPAERTMCRVCPFWTLYSLTVSSSFSTLPL